jgi:riboflavin synthase
MFTGLVEATGTLRSRSRRGPGYRLAIEAGLGRLALGESVAVDGACLTVTSVTAAGFEADASQETAERSTLGRIALGAAVNLERSLRLGDRLGGHLVSGHVDGVAVVERVVPAGEAWRATVRMPDGAEPYVAEKGSVTLDGVSLTVNAVSGSSFEVMLVPHTRQATSLRQLTAGREMNLEVDLLARYVVRYLAAAGRGESPVSQAAGPRPDLSGEQSLVQALKRARVLE